MEELIRTFIAVEISKSVRDQISRLEQHLRKEGAKVGWVRPENLHLTLKFLGNVQSVRIEDVVGATQDAVQGIKPFALFFSGLGAFPSLKRPRVIWIGVEEGAVSLGRIQKELEEKLFQRGFAREEREFSPHLTIGRVKSQKGIGGLVSKLEKTQFESEKMWVEQIVVMRSDLKPTGAVYTPLGVCQLV
ncbi:MAG: 2'-5' RNA ligase [Candidatus Latescibacteria bacterium 4484_181]|nr:MAG: 2'-5' RNA ligase [Candidatus Latescibacteria bacterium 4484_181]RKY71864.1 MAG: RNA 2',3'-cyclic phosphodiesterase [Candidatus Latescibacterota bacterium]